MSEKHSHLKGDDELLTLTQDYIKDRLQNDHRQCYHYADQQRYVRSLLERTVSAGKSAFSTAFIIGDRGSGKTALISSAVYSITNDPKLAPKFIIVHLHGLFETNDNLALKSITKQMQLENEIEGKIFDSPVENLSFLFNHLKFGRGMKSKSIIFIFDYFHLFCYRHHQTLLYFLFDAAQSDRTPICVIGLTCRLDVVKLLEKRIRSRFSHPEIFLFSNFSFSDRMAIVRQLMTLPTTKEIESSEDLTVFKENNKLEWMQQIFDPKIYTNKFPYNWVSEWNDNLVKILENPKVVEAFKMVYDFVNSLDVIKIITYRIVNDLNSSPLDVDKIQKVCAEYMGDNCAGAAMLKDLSVLEISLLIAIKHHIDRYVYDPFNFEIILTRLNKLSKSWGTTIYDRSIVLKAYEQLHQLAIIRPINVTIQKEFQMHKLNITIAQINKSVAECPNLPTAIAHWSQRPLT